MASSTSPFQPCVGFIQFTCLDAVSQETLVLGGLGHVTLDENDAAWSNLPVFEGQSIFRAVKLDANRKCIDTRQLSAHDCEQLLRRPIAALLATGRARLAARASRLAAG